MRKGIVALLANSQIVHPVSRSRTIKEHPVLRSSLARLAKQVPGLKLPKSGTTTRRKKRSAQTGPAEAVESRMMLSAVSFDAGTLTFDAAADVLDEVDVSAPDANSLVIEVGGGDTIQLNGAAAGNANFVLSNGDTVLTVNVAAGGVAEAEFNLGNEFEDTGNRQVKNIARK